MVSMRYVIFSIFSFVRGLYRFGTGLFGIATDFEEAELVGKKVTLLANLKPRSLKGIESQGMILLGENQGGHLVFVGPEDQTTASGTPIK